MYITMNTTSGSIRATLGACFVFFAFLTPWSQPAWANVRQDAASELFRLQHSAAARSKPEEIKSAEATFAIAEHYFHDNNLEQSERFYRLAIQKVRILLASLHDSRDDATSPDVSLPSSSAADEAPSTSPPPPPADDQQQTAPPPDAEPPPSPAVTPEPPVEGPESLPAAPTAPDVAPEPPVVSPETSPTPPEPGGESSLDEFSSEKIIGTASTYTVVKGDTIRLVAAKLGVTRQHLIRRNGLDEKVYLQIGQKLVFNNRKIVPQRMKNGIVVNIPDRTLYYFKQGKLAVSLPVALGVPVTSEKYDWKTPTGRFRVTAKMKDPTWHVPPSIQSEMEEHGKEVITRVAPGPENPLGKYAIKTSIPGILIHSTTKPWSIYSFASHGCIRVYPEHMEGLFKEIAVNTPGEIIYKPVKLAITEGGRVFLEVHRDVYSRSSSGLAVEARRLIEEQNLSGLVDWRKVESIVKNRAGIAEDVSL